jgi:hypothetical protein
LRPPQQYYLSLPELTHRDTSNPVPNIPDVPPPHDGPSRAGLHVRKTDWALAPLKDADAVTLALNRPGSFDRGSSISGPPTFSQNLAEQKQISGRSASN